MNGYENLANAIVLQACQDYLNADSYSARYEVIRFFRSGWFGVLTDVDPVYLMKELDKGKRGQRFRGIVSHDRSVI